MMRRPLIRFCFSRVFQVVLSVKLLGKLFKHSSSMNMRRERRYSIVIIINMFVLILSEVILISSTIIINNFSQTDDVTFKIRLAKPPYRLALYMWFFKSFLLNLLTNKKFCDETKKLFRPKWKELMANLRPHFNFVNLKHFKCF